MTTARAATTKTTTEEAKKFSRSLGSVGEKEYVLENLSMLMASGMGVVQALNAIASEVHSKPLRRAIAALTDDVEAGLPLSQAISSSRLLPAYFVSLIRIGEESGQLPEHLQVIVDQQQKDRAFKAKVRSALLYPSLVAIVGIVIGIAITWFILPRLADLFSQLDADLPPLTEFLIAVGAFLQVYGVFVMPLVIAGIVALGMVVFVLPSTRHIGHTLLFNFSSGRSIMQQIELARMGHILGTLLRSGLPLTDAFRSLREATTFRMYAKFYDAVYEAIQAGASFSDAFGADKKNHLLMPLPIQQMIVSAQQSGRLADTFLRIGQIFEARMESTTKNLATLLEPFLLVLVWIGVVMIALAVILPIYGLVGAL
ncbi:MAG: type II secretion system F family protein [Candidatus Doudnabacteria bacterium]|nr:type II secretion system F family protein [Candidatus Doudnabacteria bacterium]MCA9387434.1 type II secretion system F family protein [Candidatus Andersenbacteria bacterium]